MAHQRRSHNIAFRPPDSDSDEDYDGFYFGDDFIKRENRRFLAVETDQTLYNAVLQGDLAIVQNQLDDTGVNVNEPIKSGLTLLQLACREGHFDIARYLIEEKGANVNLQTDSVTPLMCACECASREPHIVEKIIRLLLKHDAVINVSDKYGTTPFMLACKHGHTAVVNLLLKDVSFEAVDNAGCTAIFHAIENNHPEIVKLLVVAGVNATLANRKGYTPVQVAQFHGFYDMLDILPKEREKAYTVPSQFLGYSTLRDCIPRIFLRSDCPEYFQEINSILLSIGMEQFLEYFAKERISLAEFLCMNDEKLEKVGIEYPIHRMKLLKGLLDFHLHHWSKKSIARVSKTSAENFYEILMIAANHLQHLVIITGTLRYIKDKLKGGTLGTLSTIQLQLIQSNLKNYREAMKELHKTVSYLASFSPPKNPLYIDYDEFLAERRRTKWNRFLKYTTIIIGVSIFICIKVRKRIN